MDSSPKPPAEAVVPLDYSQAAPRTGSGSSVWASAVILFAGLGLIVIGGCFLAGVLVAIHPGSFAGSPQPQAALTHNDIGLECVLYLLAFLSLAGGVWVVCVGLFNLLRIVRSK